MSDWSTRLQPGGLPVFRHTRDTLSRLAPRRDSLTAREVAQQILMDPLAALAIIHEVSTRMGERYGSEVSTVEHALMMRGIGAYLDGVRGLPVLEDTASGRDARALVALHALARRAQHAAWQARDFAILHSDIHAEELQVAALLHHAADMLLWLRASETARALDRARQKTTPGQEPGLTILGMPLADLRTQVLTAWGIPRLTRDLVDEKNATRPRQDIVGACIAIARESEWGWWNDALMAHYLTLASIENTPVDAIIATVHANAARVARACDWLATPAAAAWGPMIPGPWPQAEPDPEAGTAPAPREAPSASPAVCPMPDKAVFREALKGIETHLDGSFNLNQMSAVILKGLHTGLGLSRIVFAMVTPDGARVKSRFSLGIHQDDPLRQFAFPMNGKDLFSQLMGKMQGVWVNEGNRERLWPLIDVQLQKAIGMGDFFAMSLFSSSRPMGLIYADRGHGECGLDPLTYTDFKMLCLQASRGLGKIRTAP